MKGWEPTISVFLCRVGYLGWNFRGTNIQPSGRTVEGEMEKVLRGRVRFLSRTDAGVSAYNNYALCSTTENPFAINQLDDVWVLGYKEIERKPKVFWRWYRYYYPEEIDIPEDLLHLFEGKRDFSSFSIPEPGRSSIKEVLRFRSFTVPGFTIFDVIGRAFARQMVRRIVMGVILAVEEGLNIEELLENPRPRAVPPAPAEGLVLMDMKLNVHVPIHEEVKSRVKKRLENLWKMYRLKSKLLSDRWIIR